MSVHSERAEVHGGPEAAAQMSVATATAHGNREPQEEAESTASHKTFAVEVYGKKTPSECPTKPELEEQQHLQRDRDLEESPKTRVPQQTRLHGFLWQGLSALLLTGMITTAKVLEPERGAEAPASTSRTRRLPVLEVVLVRSLTVCLISLLLLARDKENPLGERERKPLLLLRGGLGSIGVFCLYFAVTYLPITDVIALSLTQPFWAALFGRFFLKEKLNRVLLIAAPLCGAGVLFIARPWEPSGGSMLPRVMGIMIMLLQSMAAAAAKTCVRALRGCHPQVIVIYLTFFCSGISVLGLVSSQRAIPPSFWLWGMMVLCGCFAFGSQTTSTLALRSISAAEGALINYLNLVWGMIVSVTIFSDLPSASSITGAVFIVLCTLILMRFS